MKRGKARRHTAALVMLVGVVFGVAACNGCRSAPRPEALPGSVSEGGSTLRVYAVSNLAGALEPCGCTKDQLGGIDHLAALLTRDRAARAATLFVAAGPTHFLDPVRDPARATQDEWKAEAISASLGDMGLAAFTPGFNDWSLGQDSFAALAKSTRAAVLTANVEEQASPGAKTVVREVAGIRVGLFGVAAPLSDGAPPTGVEIADAVPAAQAAMADLRRQGAKLLIGLSALPRGQALRLAEALPDLSLLVVGKPVDAGEANDAPSAPSLIGPTLIVQASNHLQTVAVVDFFVRGDDYHFQDGTGIASAEALASVEKRIHDLEVRLAAWEKDPEVRPDDLEQRRRDLAKLKEDKERLSHPPAPKSGSFFRYELVEIRDKLGTDAKVHERMAGYYRRVNDHNRVAFASRKPDPVPAGASGYVGVEVCSTCHEQERKVWDRTAHARAYATLSKQFKEYNLECVGCHVTGYEKPGGSTVTANESLRDVQCEACHGPGQAHAKSPDRKKLVLRDPPSESCVSTCHHPPHVEGFDAARAKRLIIGPGHGLPDDAPWPASAGDASDH